jgi:hypothetical protein
MELERIKAELAHDNGVFPRAAIDAAIEQRQEIIPELLSLLQEVAEDPLKQLEDPETTLPTYAFFLLAQFMEKRAYPLIIKIFSTPCEDISDTTGDFVTESLCRILASVCDGDIGPIKQLIENPLLDEYVRSAGLSAITVLVANGIVSRDDAIEYFRSLFQEKLEKEAEFMWAALVCSCCDIGPYELLQEIEDAFFDDLVDLMVVDFDCVRQACNSGEGLAYYKKSPKSKLIGNVVDDVFWWSAIDEPGTNAPTESNVYELFS